MDVGILDFVKRPTLTKSGSDFITTTVNFIVTAVVHWRFGLPQLPTANYQLPTEKVGS